MMSNNKSMHDKLKPYTESERDNKFEANQMLKVMKKKPERSMKKARIQGRKLKGQKIKGTWAYVGVTYIIESVQEEVGARRVSVDVTVIPCHKDE